MSTTIFTDNFSNTSGADVDIASWESIEQASGSPDWAYQSGTPTGQLVARYHASDQHLQVFGWNTGASVGAIDTLHIARCINSALSGLSDYIVRGHIYSSSGVENSLIGARLQSGSQSGYIVKLEYNSGAPIARLYRVDSGTRTQLDTHSMGGAVVSNLYEAILKVKGDQITWQILVKDYPGSPTATGMPPQTVTDATYATGDPGIGMQGWPAVFGGPTYYFADRFRVELQDDTVDFTLDKKFAGLPFMEGGFQSDFETLDYKFTGLPYVGESATPPAATLAAGGNTINVSAPALFIKILDRVFPNKRIEDQRESQVRHIQPLFGYQDPTLIP
jgi:hypothetical protein